MTIVRTVRELRAALSPARTGARTSRIGFVPTMGALHAGHVSLFDAARRNTDVVVASLFVNPTQFTDRRDLAAYPRDEARDAEMASGAGVDLLFAPPETEIYPDGDATVVTVGGPALGFEGTARPGHFAGVATVCLKLFAIVQPDRAYFGQKDAQQVAVIRQLARDLHLDLEIAVVPTVRDHDGVAWSSRNVRLSADERRRATALPRALRAAIRAESPEAAVAAARAELSELDVEYADIADFPGDRTLVIAVRLGQTRLIDNVPLSDPARAGLEV